ncbi:amino acid ABC transporter permease [Breoghania sp.]|uniref:amino acid ABC transporter permease n=1 Tax=Breoghania sp. TaxID=2065378 RepID=UPI002AA89275|nr:amino acid ABC transporter permease [Breoghania sp.]
MAATDFHFVRQELAPVLPPPVATGGVTGWIRANLFSSLGNTVLTLLGILILGSLVEPLIKFAFVDAVWTGENREACLASHGACWPYIKDYFPQFIYGRFPIDERWRVDIVFAGFAIGLIPLLIPSAPLKRTNLFYMLLVFPLGAFILLTGGHISASGFLLPDAVMQAGLARFWVDLVILFAVFAAIAYTIASLSNSNPVPGLAAVGAAFVLVAAICFFAQIDFGLMPVETSYWGGLLVTLVIAVSGIAASLPLGIVFALGRRSNMPVVRLVSIIFIEFWRGVPLITVLFMSSVMLPLFLPEGTNFDKLLRALIGVALFASAYMAEVVRGGLQAIPKGQYEGAMALGLRYWPMMWLIIMPQALKLVIPGIVNTFIGMFKDTTLVLIIGLFDLLGQIQSSYTDPTWATPSQSHTGYLFAAAIYWVFCFSMSRYSIFMENKLHTGHRR